MTRQRIRPGLKRSVFRECPSCSGSGLVKSAESMAIEVIRKLLSASQARGVAKITVTIEETVANYLNNKKRRDITLLEDDNHLTVLIIGREGLSPEALTIHCEDARGREIKLKEE